MQCSHFIQQHNLNSIKTPTAVVPTSTMTHHTQNFPYKKRPIRIRDHFSKLKKQINKLQFQSQNHQVTMYYSILLLSLLFAMKLQAAPISSKNTTSPNSDNATTTITPIPSILALKVKAERETASILQEIQRLEISNVRNLVCPLSCRIQT